MATQAVAIQAFRVVPYAKAIYVYGTNRLTNRTEGAQTFPGVAVGYYEAVQIYAATGKVNGVLYSPSFTGYTRAQMELALACGWLTQTELTETLAYVEAA